MSWQHDPQIREMVDYARRHGFRFGVLFVMGDAPRDETEAEVRVISFGTNARLCALANTAGAELLELVEAGRWPTLLDEGVPR